MEYHLIPYFQNSFQSRSNQRNLDFESLCLMRMLTVQPHLITDKGYLERSIKYAIDYGVTDQWLQALTCGFQPKQGMEGDVVPDSNGIMSITEREYCKLVFVS